MKKRRQAPARDGASRRRFLAGATAAASLAIPRMVGAQGPLLMRWQSAWPAKSPFHEYALDYARKVNDMTGGDVRIEVLPLGGAAPAAGLLDAVGKGVLDGAHGSIGDHYGRHPAFLLWAAGPAFGMDANMLLAWHRYGGGRALLAKVYAAVDANVLSFPYGPLPSEPLGWFRKPISAPADFRGLKFRAVGAAAEIFAALGARVERLPAEEVAAALSRGALDGAALSSLASGSIAELAEAAKVRMLQSYHQSAGQLEILLNKTKFEALPSKIRAIMENAVEAGSAELWWKAIDRASSEHLEASAQQGLRLLRTPDSVLRRQLAAFDALAREHQGDALFSEVQASQRRFAERAVRWSLDTQVGPRLAYERYFGKTSRRAPAAGTPRKK